MVIFGSTTLLEYCPSSQNGSLRPHRGYVHFKCEESDKGLSLQEMKCKFLRLLVMYICDVIR